MNNYKKIIKIYNNSYQQFNKITKTIIKIKKKTMNIKKNLKKIQIYYNSKLIKKINNYNKWFILLILKNNDI